MAGKCAINRRCVTSWHPGYFDQRPSCFIDAMGVAFLAVFIFHVFIASVLLGREALMSHKQPS